MILVPLPRFVGPTARPLFCRGEAAIDERLADINAAAFKEVFGQLLNDAFKNPCSHPLLEAPMAGLIRRIALRNVLPRRSGAKHPQDAVEHLAGMALRATTSLDFGLRT